MALFFCYVTYLEACTMFAPHPGMEPMLPALEAVLTTGKGACKYWGMDW